MEALEAAGTATGAEDLKQKEQRNAINPYAKQTFPRESEERRSREIEHRVRSGVRGGKN